MLLQCFLLSYLAASAIRYYKRHACCAGHTKGTRFRMGKCAGYKLSAIAYMQYDV